MKLLKPKAQKQAQWLVVVTAAIAGIDQAVGDGTIAPQVAVYILMATNIISAILRGLFTKEGE